MPLRATHNHEKGAKILLVGFPFKDFTSIQREDRDGHLYWWVDSGLGGVQVRRGPALP